MVVAEKRRKKAVADMEIPKCLSQKVQTRLEKMKEAHQCEQMELMPHWAEDERSIPNEIVRSALFNARNRNRPREYMKDAEICVLGDGHMRYTGEELRQYDEIVWLELLHLARGQNTDQIIEFTPYTFCKAIRWQTTGKNYDRLRECLTRMQATSLSIYCKRISTGLSMSMIPKFEWQDEHGQPLARYRVKIAPELIALFGDKFYTKIEREQRLALSPGVATWLHSYFSSHSAPFPIKIETIMKGCGASSSSLKSFKQVVKAALEELVTVGFLIDYFIEPSGLVKVTRNNKPALLNKKTH